MEQQGVMITAHPEGSVMVIAIDGRLDAASSSSAFETLEQNISEGTSAIVMDLSGLTYTSSSGLRAFLATLKEMRKENRELLIAHPDPRVLKVFTLAGFDRIFPIYDTVEEAVGAAGST